MLKASKLGRKKKKTTRLSRVHLFLLLLFKVETEIKSLMNELTFTLASTCPASLKIQVLRSMSGDGAGIGSAFLRHWSPHAPFTWLWTSSE
jgi:hypothetical protein